MLPPINLKQWIDAHKEQLKPPVCNQQVYESGDFIIMVIGGPNSRKDYHDDPGDEFFFQLRGDMVLRIMENGKPKDIPIKEGEIFLLPPHVPHSPQRFESTAGFGIERTRDSDEKGGFIWFCDKCHHQLHREEVSLKSIVQDLPPIFKRFWDSESNRTCKKCGDVLQPPVKK